MYGQAHVAGR